MVFSQTSTIFLKLCTCCLSKYDKSRVERFSNAKSIFKHVFFNQDLGIYTFKFRTCQNRKNDGLVNKSVFVNGHF